MSSKTDLFTIINNLPDEKLPAAFEALRGLNNPQTNEHTKEPSTDQLYQFFKTFVTSVNNSLYDLSVEFDRKGEKILAKRLDFSRKKIVDAWSTYENFHE